MDVADALPPRPFAVENAEDEDDPAPVLLLFSQVPEAGDGPRDPQPVRRFVPSITATSNVLAAAEDPRVKIASTPVM